ncbi:hypothetical protein [Roseibacillus persicicus]|uniref:Cytochrome c domain-containing protein n=1 Tax=Roseibacillus persicicus TaxID=454148 RepID=A0A918TW90_9BACT|nr:hypothetical protein [Roseibacillus persicicus]GHC63174.1 hypothetical protein GCM10007100_33330 [Roseibacillus persicicus]
MTSRLAILFLTLAMPLHGQDFYEESPVKYSKTEADTALTRIQKRIESGESLLRGESDREILQEVLDILEVPVESQVLVYSKTSAQNSHISPWTPRAIYFSDNAYIGWVQNGNIETITFDKKLGAVFHLIDLNRREKGKAPEFRRERGCLSCHASSATDGAPGILVRSVYPDSGGRPLFDWGSFDTSHHSPVTERWGGWYVTGKAGPAGHLGNQTYTHDDGRKSLTGDGPVVDLSEHLNTKPYLGGGSSDVVALMILEHQVTVHNAILSGHLATQRFLFQNEAIRKATGEPADTPLSETYRHALEHYGDKIVRALLFEGEFEFVDDGAEGSEAFQKAFAAGATTSKDGRSLRDLRLYERLFKYRCSYMIYSDSFRDLQPLLKEEVLRKLRQILTEPEEHPDFGYLSKSERKRILKILEETLPVWKKLQE